MHSCSAAADEIITGIRSQRVWHIRSRSGQPSRSLLFLCEFVLAGRLSRAALSVPIGPHLACHWTLNSPKSLPQFPLLWPRNAALATAWLKSPHRGHHQIIIMTQCKTLRVAYAVSFIIVQLRVHFLFSTCSKYSTRKPKCS